MRPACVACAKRDFSDCLHSPILRGLKVFVLWRERKAALVPDRINTSLFAATPSSPALVSQTKTSFAEFFSGLIERSAMNKITLGLAVASLFLTPPVVRAQFANAVISYDHGTGFAANFTNANASLGAPTSGSSVTPFAPPFSTSQIVSIGAGGSLTLQLSTPIVNNPANPFGIDLLILGNSF